MQHNNKGDILKKIIYYFLIFGIISIITLYAANSILPKNLENIYLKQLFFYLICSIFILIAGSYTPFSLCTLREYSTALGWTIFGVIWAFAILGITLNAIDLKKYKTFSMICYLAMGWCVIIKLPLLISLLGIPGTILLVLGGIAYTVGAVLYGIGKKHKYIHSIFHLFIVLGSVLQFFTILLYVM